MSLQEKLLEKATYYFKISIAELLPRACEVIAETGMSNAAEGRSVANIKSQAVTQESVVGSTKIKYFACLNTCWHVSWQEGKSIFILIIK